MIEEGVEGVYELRGAHRALERRTQLSELGPAAAPRTGLDLK
jgi:hypothetical protein